MKRPEIDPRIVDIEQAMRARQPREKTELEIQVDQLTAVLRANLTEALSKSHPTENVDFFITTFLLTLNKVIFQYENVIRSAKGPSRKMAIITALTLSDLEKAFSFIQEEPLHLVIENYIFQRLALVQVPRGIKRTRPGHSNPQSE